MKGNGSVPPVETVDWESPELWQRSLDSIDVWRVDWVMRSPSGQSEAVADGWAETLLHDSERARAARLVVPNKRRQFLRSRAALRFLLARRLDVAPQSLVLRSGDHGRPEVDDLIFNLSHSGSVAVIALGAERTTRLGIDVERVETARPVDRLVERFFAPMEVDSFAQCAPAGRAADFARRWALKEAYVKALGTGLTYSSREFALRDDPVTWEARPLLVSCARHGAGLPDWSFRNAWLEAADERFAMALCSDQGAPTRTFRFDFPGDHG